MGTILAGCVSQGPSCAAATSPFGWPGQRRSSCKAPALSLTCFSAKHPCWRRTSQSRLFQSLASIVFPETTDSEVDLVLDFIKTTKGPPSRFNGETSFRMNRDRKQSPARTRTPPWLRRQLQTNSRPGDIRSAVEPSRFRGRMIQFWVMREDITLLPEPTDRLLRTIKDPQRLPRYRHLQKAIGPVICPFCHQDLDWDAAGAARVCSRPRPARNGSPGPIEALCEKCSGYLTVRLIETGQLRVTPQDVPDWLDSAEKVPARREERKRLAQQEAARRALEASKHDEGFQSETATIAEPNRPAMGIPQSLQRNPLRISWPRVFRP